jgi:hypothetical protein
MFEVGDTVQLLQSKFISGLKQRINHPVIGVIKSIDGSYIYIQPEGCDWEIEQYPNEITKVHK